MADYAFRDSVFIFWLAAALVHSPAAYAQDSQVDLDSLVGRKMIVVGYSPGKTLKLPYRDLAKRAAGSCDIAVEIRAVFLKRGELTLGLERIGKPWIPGLKNVCPGGTGTDNFTIVVTGLQVPVTNEGLAPLWENVLVSPDRYLVLRGQSAEGKPTDGAVTSKRSPQELLQITPAYTRTARESKLSGTIRMQIEIGTDGLIHSGKVLEGIRRDLDAQALRVLPLYRFVPGQENGKPVPVTATIEITFRIY